VRCGRIEIDVNAQQNSADAWMSLAKNQIAESFVVGYDNTVLFKCEGQDAGVWKI
jgi:hypothetical protein